MMKLWEQNAYDQKKAEQKRFLKGLLTTGRNFDRWYGKSEKQFGKFLNERSKTVENHEKTYKKNFGAYVKTTQKDLDGLQKTFEKDVEMSDKASTNIVDAQQSTKSSTETAIADLDRAHQEIEKEVEQMMSSSDEPLGLTPALSRSKEL